MTGKWKRPEYIELSQQQIDWHMQRGRQLRSQAAIDLMKAIAAYIRRTLADVSAARYLPESAQINERRAHT